MGVVDRFHLRSLKIAIEGEDKNLAHAASIEIQGTGDDKQDQSTSAVPSSEGDGIGARANRIIKEYLDGVLG